MSLLLELNWLTEEEKELPNNYAARYGASQSMDEALERWYQTLDTSLEFHSEKEIDPLFRKGN